MTDTYSTPAPYPTSEHGNWDTPPPKKKRWFAKPAALIPIGTLVLGIAVGAGTVKEPDTVTVQGPERTVEKRVEVPVEKIVTKTVEVPVTPPECITALDLAADMVGNLAGVGDLASDGIVAAYNRNAPALEKVTAKVEALNQKITDGTPAVGAATQACRASAK